MQSYYKQYYQIVPLQMYLIFSQARNEKYFPPSLRIRLLPSLPIDADNDFNKIVYNANNATIEEQITKDEIQKDAKLGIINIQTLK
jgi:hypothetical protein